jgi:hypothetical protein
MRLSQVTVVLMAEKYIIQEDGEPSLAGHPAQMDWDELEASMIEDDWSFDVRHEFLIQCLGDGAALHGSSGVVYRVWLTEALVFSGLQPLLPPEWMN